MKRVISYAIVSTIVAGAATASAQPSANTEACVPRAQGVPGNDPALGAFYGPPLWVPSWDGVSPTRAIDPFPNDPRWINAGGSSISDTFTTGSTLAPVEVRMLSSTIEGGTYLYLSWTLNVGDVDGARTLRVALAPTGQTAKVLRVQLPPAAPLAPGTIIGVDECTSSTDGPCDAASAAHYRVYTEDSAGHFVYCKDGSAPTSDPCHPDNVTPSWLAQSLRAWKDPTGVWVVQLRIPVVAGATRFAQGIVASTSLGFDAAIDTGGTFGTFKWPRTFAFTNSPLETSEITTPAVSTWGSFRSKDGIFPAPATGTCSGIRVEPISGLGIIHDPTGGTNYLTDALTTQIKGAPTGTPVTNELVVRVENNSDKDIQVSELIARFRIAKWGAQIGDIIGDDLANAWQDVRGGNAVANGAIIAHGTTGAIHFPWALNSTERCLFGVPNASDLAGVGCVTMYGAHQCIMVDLTGASTLDADFETRGTWNNFDFSDLSVTEDIATIDVRGLPIPPGQGVEVYLFGMARHMPESVPPGTTGGGLVSNTASDALMYEQRIFGGAFYGSGEVTFNPQEVHLHPIEPALHDGRAWGQLPQVQLPPVIRFLPEPVYRRYRAIAVLQQLSAETNPSTAARAVVGELGAAEASSVLPTLDIYAMYRDPSSQRLLPLTAFTYFLSHQGALTGLHWVIDGATRVSPNTYKIVVASGANMDVKVKIQAQVEGEDVIKHDPSWTPSGGGPPVPPVCTGCCCGRAPSPSATPRTALGTGLPIIAVAVVIGWPRRRRRKQPRT